MNEGLLIALIGLGGAIAGAFLTSVLQPLLTKWITPKANLVVTIKHNTFQIPELISRSIEDYLVSQYKVKIRPEIRDIFVRMKQGSGYSEITIENRSSKAVNSISFTLEDGWSFSFEITMDGKSSNTGFSTACEIGTIKANSSCSVRMWTYSDHGERFFYKKSNFIKITAEEIDGIKIIDQAPRYVLEKYRLISRELIGRIGFYVWILFLFLSFSIPALLYASK